jgi:hypothetical protein
MYWTGFWGEKKFQNLCIMTFVALRDYIYQHALRVFRSFSIIILVKHAGSDSHEAQENVIMQKVYCKRWITFSYLSVLQ